MVATLVRLRWRLTINALSRNVWAMIGMIIGTLYGIGGLLALIGGAVGVGRLTAPVATEILGTAGALLVLGWVVVPLTLTGVDATLDPRAMAAWTAPSPSLARGLAVAGASGVPGILTALGLSLPVLSWAVAGQWAAAAAALVLAPVGLATCVLLSRVVVIGLGVSGSRRGREMMAVLAVVLVLAVSVLPAMLNAMAQALDDDLIRSVRTVGRVAGLTPLGWATAAPGYIAQGRALLGLLLAVGALVLPVLLMPLWARVVRRVMTGPARQGGRKQAYALEGAGAAAPAVAGGRAVTLVWHRRLARLIPSPAAAVAARCLRYWRTDPRYLSQVVASLAMPFMLWVLGAFGPRAEFVGPEGQHASTAGAFSGAAPLGAVVLVAVLVSWGMHNDLGLDSTALWQHVSAGLRGVHDRLGRICAAALWQLPVVLVLGLIGAAWFGQWRALPAVLGLSLGLYAGGTAWSAVTSVVLPYETNPPGESPMKARTSGTAVITALLQMLGLAGIGLLGAPVVAGFIVIAVTGAWGWGWMLLAGALVWGTGVVGGGIVLAGRVLDARAVRVLATIRSWPGHEQSA